MPTHQTPMLTHQQVLDLVQARLDDAEVLLNAQRLDGSLYLCGYSVELALKARIVKHLKWAGLPEKGRLFHVINKHDLDYLLEFTGIKDKIKTMLAADWSLVQTWGPEQRYKLGVKQQDAQDMLDAARRLIKVIAK